MHDSLGNSTGTVLEADFYHADQLLPQSDKDLVAKVSSLMEEVIARGGIEDSSDRKDAPLFI